MPCAELHHLAHTIHPRTVALAPHRTTMDEIVVVVRGRLVMVVDGCRLELSGGMVAANPAGCEKALVPAGSRGEYLWFGLGGGPGRPVLDPGEAAVLRARVAALARQAEPLDPPALRAARDLAAACGAGAPRLVRLAAGVRMLAGLCASAAGTGHDPGLAPVRSLIRSDPVAAAELRLADLAARCGLGRTVFCRRWRAETGLSPADAILRARLALAAPVLAAGGMVADAARTAGYRSVSAFSSAWRREHGSPPGSA